MMWHKFKIILWLACLLIVCLSLYKAFHPLYLSTQKLKATTSSSDRFSDINLKVIPAISHALELEAIHAKRLEPLRPEDHAKRQRRLADLASRYPNAHEFYVSKCLTCHGPVGEGGKTIKRMDSRFSYRAAPYVVPPLVANNDWTTNLENFYNAATKLNRPHLPRTSGITDKALLMELQSYLKQLVE